MLFPLLALVAAAEPVAPSTALPPSGKWLVEYAETMCVLSRDYGAGADKVTIGLRPMPMSQQSEVVLITRDRGATKFNGHAEIALAPGAKPVSGSYGRFPLPKGAGRIATMYFDDDALAGLEGASELEIGLDRERHRFAIPNIAGAMKVLSACQDNLLRHWNIDPAERAAESTHVSGNPGRFFGPSEYPRDAIVAGAQGRTVAIGKVGVDGRVEACIVAVTSGNRSLDEATCRIMRNSVRFSPARDKDGKPVASHYVLPVRWVLPGN